MSHEEEPRVGSSGYPTFRIAVVFEALGGGLGGRVAAAAAVEPGARWEVVRGDEEDLPAGLLDAAVYPAIAESRRSRALARLEAECARRGVELVRVPLSTPELADELPRRLRLSRVLDLTPPSARRSVARAQRSFAFEALAGRSTVRLPPAGPTVSLTRLEGGVRLETVGSTDRRAVTLRWGSVQMDAETVGFDRATQTALPDQISLRTRGDVLTAFADDVAGERGGPRVLLEEFVRRARVWLLRALPPRARAAARPFHPALQALVATRALADPTGRVAQLARVCPGAFCLAASVVPFYEGLDEACRLTIEGRSLAQALAPLLRDWAATRFARASATRQLRFLRRAGPAVPPDALLFPFLEELSLDDIPLDRAANAAWFQAVAVLTHMAVAAGRRDIARLGPFVSANAVALARLEPDALAGLLRRLHLRGRHLGRWPGRRTSVQAARAVVRPWPEAEHSGAPSRVALLPSTDPRLSIRVLETAADLAVEGERMHHCVATFTKEVELGDTLALALAYGKERLTATVYLMSGGVLVLDQLSGFANAEPSRAAACAIEAWLASHGGSRPRS